MLVLITEDELPSRVALTLLVQKEGHQVIACESAERAFEEIDAAAREKRQIRLGLIDWDLGAGRTGIEVAMHLRRLHPFSSAILISGYSREQIREQWRDPIAGFTAFLPKPFDMDVLKRFLRLAADGCDEGE